MKAVRIGTALVITTAIMSWGGAALAQEAPAGAPAPPEAAHVADDSGNGPTRPMLECVAANGDGSYTAVFGSYNPSGKARREPVGIGNFFVPGNPNRGQPTEFGPDRTVASFSTTFTGSFLSWTLNGRTVVATASSQPCNTAPSVSEAGVPAALAVALAVTSGGWMWRRRRTA